MAECGTVAGYYAHYRGKERPCVRCRAAANQYQRDRYARIRGARIHGRITMASVAEIVRPGTLRSMPLRTDIWPLLCLGDPDTGEALCGRTGTKVTGQDQATAVHTACLRVLWGPPRRPESDPYNLILPRQAPTPPFPRQARR